MPSDNAKLQTLINKGGVVNIPVDKYLIDPEVGLMATKPSTINFTGSFITALPSDSEKYAMLTIEGDDIHIIGGMFVGDRNKHQGTAGEWGMGIKLRHANKISIHNTTLRDCWGDGLYIGSGSTGVIIEMVTCQNNRRQGLSLTEGKDIKISQSTFELTHGTEPQCGIDIEPDKMDVVENVLITGCRFRQNSGDAHINVAGKKGAIRNLTVNKCLYDNSAKPIKLQADYPDLWSRIKGKMGDYSGYPKSISNYTQEGKAK